MPWRIQLFGKIVAQRGDLTIDRFATRKNAELLGYLATSPGSSFSRQHLCRVLWPDSEDLDAARVRLRQAISSIRRQLEPPGIETGSVLVTERDTVYLNRTQVESDFAEFEVAVSLMQASPPEKRRRHLSRIIELHRGDFMAGLAAEWIVTEQENCHRRFIQSADAMADLCFEDGDWKGAAAALKSAVEIEQYDESRYLKLMTAHRYMGRLKEALAVYQEIASRLQRDLGLKPSSEILTLAASIRSEADSGVRPNFERIQVRAPEEQRESARRFPAPSTRLYGREQELEKLRATVADKTVRLITLIGPGGVGKTRLALELAEKLFFDLSGDVWFTSLADLTNGHEIGAAIIDVLPAQPQPGLSSIDVIVDHLACVNHPVLILDNFENLVEDGAPLVRQLLDRLPNLCCLITSRQSLELDGEHQIRVGLLALPDPLASTSEELIAYSSVQLFVDRAKLARSDFQITPGNAKAIAELSHRLEGIPLAIEICAALCQTVTPAQMVAGLSKRFELLVSRRRDIVPRHRSLRAAIEYSYRTLSPDLAFIFRQLAIFQGGWSADSAQSIFGGINMQDALRQLHQRSLVTSEEVTINGAATLRFRMLETFRVFAWEMLSSVEQETLAQRHQAHFSDFAKDKQEKYFNNDANVAELELEQANMMAAIRWCIADGRLKDGVELCSALYHFWMIKGHQTDGIYWFQSLLDHPQFDEIPLEARCLVARRLMHLTVGGLGISAASDALNLFVELAEELGDRANIAHARSCQGIYCWELGDVGKAIEYCEAALEESRTIGGPEVGGTLLDLADIRYRAEDYRSVIELCMEAHPISKSFGFRLNACNALNLWACSLVLLQRFQEARDKFEDALQAAQSIGAPAVVLAVHLGMTALFLLQDQFEEAGEWLLSALNPLLGAPRYEQTSYAIQMAAYMAEKNQRYETAALLADALRSLKSRSNPLQDPLFTKLTPDSRVVETYRKKTPALNRQEILQIAITSVTLAPDRLATTA
jgi:predicted ATPase/DNA-binding SARP family transcriptional activator